MLRSTSLVVATLAICVSCQFEPGASCDDTRIAWGFAEHEISTADDVSAEPGLQIDLTLLSALPEGKPAVLILEDENGVETTHPQTSQVDAQGRIQFDDVNLPTGSVLFTVRTENDCRAVESRNRRFVRDDDVIPVCEISFAPEPRPIAGREPLRSYIAEDDQDLVLPQLQASVTVTTGRAQMLTRLLIVNRSTQTSTTEERTTDASGAATIPVSLGQGEIAIRALCTDGPNSTPQSSATFEILVDTEAPDCALLAPSARVTAGQDLDGDTSNGIQVIAVAQTSDASSIGLDAAFTVNGGAPITSEIGVAGQSTAEITVPVGGGAQVFEVTLSDLAGNECSSSRTF